MVGGYAHDLDQVWAKQRGNRSFQKGSGALGRRTQESQKQEGNGPYKNQTHVRAGAFVFDQVYGFLEDQAEDKLTSQLEIFPAVILLLTAQINGVEGGLAAKQVQKRSVVGLDDEEEYLLQWNIEEFGTDHGVFRVRPNTVADQVGVPWSGGDKGDLDKVRLAM